MKITVVQMSETEIDVGEQLPLFRKRDVAPIDGEPPSVIYSRVDRFDGRMRQIEIEIVSGIGEQPDDVLGRFGVSNYYGFYPRDDDYLGAQNGFNKATQDEFDFALATAKRLLLCWDEAWDS